MLSSSDSPRIGASRTSSSRLSFQDDLDDGDFSCPFDVDDVDPPNVLSRYFVEISYCKLFYDKRSIKLFIQIPHK